MADHITAQNHYDLLRIKPTASPQQIRRAYRDLSKLYHPDTTKLPPAIATEKFQILNEAYATLSNPEKRVAYDYSIGISKVAVMQAPAYLNRPASERRAYEKSNAYLDPTDRPLSAGELFALFILGVTFVGCLVLVVTIGWAKGEIVLQSTGPETTPTVEILETPAPSDTAIQPELSATATPAPTVEPSLDNTPEPIGQRHSSPPTQDINADPLPSLELSSKMI